MKKSSLVRLMGLALLALLLLIGLPRAALAHFPASDGSMAAELHIEPDDNPQPGQRENVYFIFDDTSGKFKLANCDCRLTISSNGSQVYSGLLQPQPASANSEFDTIGVPLTFQSGAYHYSVEGTPKSTAPNSFQSFALNWNLSVAPAEKPASTSSHKLVYLFVGLLLLFLAVAMTVIILT